MSEAQIAELVVKLARLTERVVELENLLYAEQNTRAGAIDILERMIRQEESSREYQDSSLRADISDVRDLACRGGF